MINSMQMALIKKDIRSITENKRLFSVLLIVPLIMTVVLPSVFVLLAGLLPIDSPDFQELLAVLPKEMVQGDLRESLIRVIFNNIISVFFLLIPIMASSVVAGSSFVGEKEKRTLETLLYCPLSLRQIFSAKIIASFALSQLVSFVSFAAMFLVIQTEIWFITGGLILPGPGWLILMLLVSPALSLVGISLIVRGSAKAKTVEESQQRSVFLILPIILLAVGQFSGLLMVSGWILLGVGILCAAVGLILLRRSSASFHYERLLQ